MSDQPTVTICAHCMHLHKRETRGGFGGSKKIEYLCMAARQINHIDLVEGTLDMGHKSPYDVNDGNCKLFSPVNALIAEALAERKASS